MIVNNLGLKLQSEIERPNARPTEISRLALGALEHEIGGSLAIVEKAAVHVGNPLVYTLFLLALNIQKVNTVIRDAGISECIAKERAITSVVSTLFQSPEAKEWVHGTTQEGLTPLHYAAQTGKVLLVDRCLIGGAKPDALRRPESVSPLHVVVCSEASNREKHRVIKRLVDCGADITATANGGFTPFDYALQRALPDATLELLRPYGISRAARDLCTLCARRRNHKAIASMNLDSTTLRGYNEKGFTPLHAAAASGATSIARVLIEENAGIRALSHGYKLAPVHIALLGKNWRTVNLFLDHGAELLTDKETLRNLRDCLQASDESDYFGELEDQISQVLEAECADEYIMELDLDPQNPDSSFVKWFRDQFS